MAKTLWLGAASSFQLELTLIEKEKADKSLLWGQGKLTIAKQPAICDAQENAIEWTWIDLLEFLAKNWHYLLLEQTLPFDIKTPSLHTLMRDLECRWENMPEEQVENEEEHALSFLARHDLANAFKGIYFPSIYILRLGKTFQITLLDTKQTLELSFEKVQIKLTQIANELVKLAKPHSKEGSRAATAIQLWETRQERIAKQLIPLSTGMNESALQKIAANNQNFWEINNQDHLADTELMAAARMTNGYLSLSQQEQMLKLIRQLPCQPTPELDQLSSQFTDQDFKQKTSPYDQGYLAAQWLRKRLAISNDEPIQPKEILENWGVSIKRFTLENANLDALACWGANYGPAILINQMEKSTAAHEFGENSTLAHEICHLLLDRNTTMPVAEVLNGNSPERLEQRARAFAAELLLPRETAAQTVQQNENLTQSIRQLSAKYKVSEHLVALQIKNSSIYNKLSADEQHQIEMTTKSKIARNL